MSHQRRRRSMQLMLPTRCHHNPNSSRLIVNYSNVIYIHTDSSGANTVPWGTPDITLDGALLPTTYHYLCLHPSSMIRKLSKTMLTSAFFHCLLSWLAMDWLPRATTLSSVLVSSSVLLQCPAHCWCNSFPKDGSYLLSGLMGFCRVITILYLFPTHHFHHLTLQ